MEYAPTLGPHGLVIIFGGESPDITGYDPGYSRRSMDNITVYDPKTQIWYSQAASGDHIPYSRLKFCTVIVEDPRPIGNETQGTYEMSVSNTCCMED